MTPLFAGVSQMKYVSFLPYSLAATATWALTSAILGYAFGEYWNELLVIARNVGYGFVALLILFMALYFYRRRAKNKRAQKL